MKYQRAKAYEACMQVEAPYKLNKCRWSDLYKTEQEIIDDLKSIYVPKSRTPLGNCFKGYQFIYSFVLKLQNGQELTDKQLTQAKRLALEVKKAATESKFIEE